MKGIQISDDFVSQIFGRPAGKLSESTVEVEGQDEVLEEDVHVCPLCDSELNEAISEERIQEHIDFFLSVINENFDFEGDDLDESELEEVDEEGDGEDVDEMCGPKHKNNPMMKLKKPKAKPGK